MNWVKSAAHKIGNMHERAATSLIGLVVLLVCAIGTWVAARTVNAGAIAPTKAPVLAIVPLDDRPASTQFVQMIGRIADYDILMPPQEILGYFTRPGDTDRLREWLMNTDFSGVDALIVSADMLAYGGLIASRIPKTPATLASERLNVLRQVREKYPNLPIYLFSSVMRVALTSERRTRSYRADLSLYVQYLDRAAETNDTSFLAKAESLRKRLPQQTIDNYFATRERNLSVNLHCVELAKSAAVDFLLLCQDDAQPYGPHHRDQRILLRALRTADLEAKAMLMEGIDEASNVLASRAILRKYGVKPKIAAFYTSDAGKATPGPFENRPVSKTVEFHATAAGARIVEDYREADIYLYVNTSKRTADEFTVFTDSLIDSVRRGKSVAIADLNFSTYSGGGDTKLVKSLMGANVGHNVIAYAGWNTPGNTLGTSIPQANLYLLAKKYLFNDPLRMERCERAQREFLMHRYVNDYGYHTVVRPKAYKFVANVLKQPIDEMDSASMAQATAFVRSAMGGIVRTVGDSMFRGRQFSIRQPENTYVFTIRSVKQDWRVDLPWPRAYEVRVDFGFDTSLRSGVPNPPSP